MKSSAAPVTSPDPDPIEEDNDTIAQVPSTVDETSEPSDAEDEEDEDEETAVTLATHREIQEEIDAPLRESEPPADEA